jgi:signal transduction histidine kinase
MRAPGYLALRPVVAAPGSVPAGPAVTTLTAMAVRTTSAIRGLAFGYIAVQVVIWWPFFAADPRRLTGPLAAAVCAAAVVCRLRWSRPGWWLVGLDSGAAVALALGAVWCVPPAMHGDTANWLFIAMVTQLLVPAWFAPGAWFAPLALASAASYWAGAAASPAAGATDNSPAAAAAMLLATAAVAWYGPWVMYRRAAVADAALARADQDSRGEYVALSRSTERREHERLLHDTVLNTLTALARGGGSDAAEVRARCRHDITLMEYALRDTGEADPAALGPYGGLLIGIEAVATEMRSRGLIVHVDASGRGLGDERPPVAVPVTVPVAVATAIAHAVREALANVASHAGTGTAWVQVRLLGPAAAAVAGGLQVTVRDAGAGFDPARIDPARLGLRRSIIERVADWGGTASVRSAPGQGTVVTLCWLAPADPRPAGPAGLDALAGRDVLEHADLSW